MALQISIKESSRGEVIGFNNSGIPLGQRPQKDLNDLLKLAYDSGNPDLLRHFDNPPTVDDLNADLEAEFLAANPVAPIKPAATAAISKKSKESDNTQA